MSGILFNNPSAFWRIRVVVSCELDKDVAKLLFFIQEYCMNVKIVYLVCQGTKLKDRSTYKLFLSMFIMDILFTKNMKIFSATCFYTI